MIKLILFLFIIDINLSQSLKFVKNLNKWVTVKPKKRIELNHTKYVLYRTNYSKNEVYVWREKDYNKSYVFESMNKSVPIDTLKFNSIEYFKVDNTRRINFGCLIGLIPIGGVFQLEKKKVKMIQESLRDDKYPELIIALITPLLVDIPLSITSMTIGGTIGLLGAKVRKKLKSKEGIVGGNEWHIVPN